MRLTAITALLALTTLTSCTIGPGDYAVLRIAAVKDPIKSASCYPDMVIDPNVAMDNYEVRSGDSLAIFASDKETYWLEWTSAAVAIEGSRDGKDYTFNGIDTDVEEPVMGERTTNNYEHGIKITIAGSSVTGQYLLTHTCMSTLQNACPYASCVSTTDFVGTVVKGVELEHGI